MSVNRFSADGVNFTSLQVLAGSGAEFPKHEAPTQESAVTLAAKPVISSPSGP